jgi:hypothetical protein
MSVFVAKTGNLHHITVLTGVVHLLGIMAVAKIQFHVKARIMGKERELRPKVMENNDSSSFYHYKRDTESLLLFSLKL